MVQEVRKVILSANEIRFAFEAYRKLIPDFLPAGEIISCAAQGGNGVVVTLATPGKQNTDFTIKLSDAVRPLVRLCLENKIMLPRDGHKSVEIFDGCIYLCIVYQHDIAVVDMVGISDPMAAKLTSVVGAIQAQSA